MYTQQVALGLPGPEIRMRYAMTVSTGKEQRSLLRFPCVLSSHLLQCVTGAATAQDVPHHLAVQQLGSSRCGAVCQQLGEGVAKQAEKEVREQLPEGQEQTQKAAAVGTAAAAAAAA